MNLKLIELYYLIKLLEEYEIGLIDIIKFYLKTYTFNDDRQLKDSVNLWCKNSKLCIIKYGHISYWDVSRITFMDYLFYNKKEFNEDISRWEVSNVKDMGYMFYNCKNFNKNISNWDIRKVNNMFSMFRECSNFNQDISNWDMSKVRITNSMFRGCISFNKNLTRWKLESILDKINMFKECNILEEYKPIIN